MRKSEEIKKDIDEEKDGLRDHRQRAITQEILLDIRDLLEIYLKKKKSK